MLLVLLLLVSTFTVGVAAIADRDKLVTRAVQVLLRQGSSALENSRALPPIMSDGSFAGIDYKDANISVWEPLGIWNTWFSTGSVAIQTQVVGKGQAINYSSKHTGIDNLL